MINRRGFIAGLFAAPAIVRFELLMPVKRIIIPHPTLGFVGWESKIPFAVRNPFPAFTQLITSAEQKVLNEQALEHVLSLLGKSQ